MSGPAGLEEAFLADIVAHPEDPTLWLILADWLDEREDPRGELVRLTWSLSHEPKHASFAQRQARVQDLLAGGLLPIRPRRTTEFGLELVWIEPGTFLMGSVRGEPYRMSKEKRHPVTLTRGFWMGTYPVTQHQWQSITGNNPSGFSRHGEYAESLLEVTDAELLRFPVENVSWEDIQGFLGTLNGRTNRVFRLPTEAEWEYACRAGTTTPFHFGHSLNATQANCDGTSPYGTDIAGRYLRRPTPVGEFPPNAWGLYDMHGNVWNWVRDRYEDDYTKLPAVDPECEAGSLGTRVLRGGSWLNNPQNCRSARRDYSMPTFRYQDNGLRVVLDAG